MEQDRFSIINVIHNGNNKNLINVLLPITGCPIYRLSKTRENCTRAIE